VQFNVVTAATGKIELNAPGSAYSKCKIDEALRECQARPNLVQNKTRK